MVSLALMCSASWADIFRTDYDRIGFDGGTVQIGEYEFTDFVSIDTVFESATLAHLETDDYDFAPPDYLPPEEANAAHQTWVIYE